ncbi:MAG: hypothetical protein RJB13_632, partial [Pseudomonadota bacterium]
PVTVASECRFFVSLDAMKNWTQVHATTDKKIAINKVGQSLLRGQETLSSNSQGVSGTRQPKADSVFISRDGGTYWAPLSLPPEFASGAVAKETDVYSDKGSLVLRKGGKIAISQDARLSTFKTYALPSNLSDAELVRVRELGDQIFLVFQNGLLFADKNLQNWSQIAVQSPVHRFKGLLSAHGRLYGWKSAHTEPGGLFVSSDGGISFKNITSRLSLLDGFYNESKPAELASLAFISLGYQNPVIGMVRSGQKIFAATPEGVAVSEDMGKTFSFLEGQQGRSRPVAESIDALGQRVVLGSTRNGILLSNDRGENWQAVTTATGLPTNNIKTVTLSDTALVVHAASNSVFASKDDGVSWREVNLSEATPGESFFKVLLSKGVILYQSYLWDQTVRGTYRVVNSRITSDLGNSFQDVKIDNGDPAGRYEYKFDSFLSSDKGYFLGGPSDAAFLDKSSTAWQLRTVNSGGMMTAVNVGSSIYYSTGTGLYVSSPMLPMSLSEVPGTSQLSSSQSLEECDPQCKPIANDKPNKGHSSADGTLANKTPTLLISQCEFSKVTGKCEVQVEWRDAPDHSCLWISENDRPAVSSDCASLEKPTQALITLDHLKPGSDYSFFLAHEVSKGRPGEIFAQATLSIKTELTVSDCKSRLEANCVAEIAWKNAPANSCVWGYRPLYDKPHLVACAVSNPNSHSLTSRLIFYGENTFFLARQSNDPNVPLNEEFAKIRVNQSPPAGFPGYEKLLSLPLFDAKYYLDFYPDLQNAFGPENYERATIHWLEYGLADRRKGAP